MGSGLGWRPPRPLGHPLHPATTHLPLGVLAGSVLWDCLALWTGSATWWELAWWSLLLGLAGSVPAVITGLLEYAVLPEGHSGEARARVHMLSALSALALFAGSALLRRDAPGSGGALPAAISWTGLGLLALAGWAGADLVFRHGVGTDLPEETPGGPQPWTETRPPGSCAGPATSSGSSKSGR